MRARGRPRLCIGEVQESRWRVVEQAPRHYVGRLRPPVASARAGEDSGTERRQHDVRELQPLGLVGGHQEDGVAGGDVIDSRRGIECLGVAEPGEERRHRSRALGTESSGQVTEGRHGTRVVDSSGPDRHLHAEARRSQDAPDEIDGSLVEMPAQPPHLADKPPQPLDGQDRQRGQGFGAVRHRLDDLPETDPVARVDAQHGLSQASLNAAGRHVDVIFGAHLGRTGQGAQRREVAGPDAPTSAREYAHERHVGSRIVKDLHDRAHLGDGRYIEESGHAHQLRRDIASAQCAIHVDESLSLAREDSDAGPGALGRVQSLDLVAHPLDLVGVGG